MGVQSARRLAALGVTEAGLATEGVRNSDFTYDNPFKRYDKELQRHDEELQRLTERDNELQNRVAFLEGLLSRVISMMQSGNIDAAEVKLHATWSTRVTLLTNALLARLLRCSETLIFNEFTWHLLFDLGVCGV